MLEGRSRRDIVVVVVEVEVVEVEGGVGECWRKHQSADGCAR